MLGAAADAAILQYEFQAEIVSVTTNRTSDRIPDFTTLVTTTDVISGRFSYDTAQPEISSVTSDKRYSGGFADFTFSMPGYSQTFSSTAGDNFQFTVAKRANEDRFKILATNVVTHSTGFITQSLDFRLEDPTGTALPDQTMPVDLASGAFLSNVASRSFTFTVTDFLDFASSPILVGQTYVSARITSLTSVPAVPLPGAGLLLVAAVTGLGFAGRKKRQVSA